MAFQQTQVYSTKRINLHHKYYVGKKCDVGFSYTTKPCKTRVYHPDVGNVYNISQRQVLYAIRGIHINQNLMFCRLPREVNGVLPIYGKRIILRENNFLVLSILDVFSYTLLLCLLAGNHQKHDTQAT